MVSSQSLEYDPEDDDQYAIPTMPPALTPHLPDLSPMDNGQDPLTKARDLLDELLDMSCEVPLHEVNEMAEDSGVTTSQVLEWAEKSGSCHVDWISGHIRCNYGALDEDEDEDEDEDDG
jgi:hypothetical protein